MNRLKKLFLLLLMCSFSQTVLAEADFIDTMTNKLACLASNGLVAGKLMAALEKEPRESRAIIHKYLPPSLSEKDKEFNLKVYDLILSDVKWYSSNKNLKCRGVVTFHGNKYNTDINNISAVVYSYIYYKKPNEMSYVVVPYYHKGVNESYLVSFSDSWDSLSLQDFLTKEAIGYILSNY